VVNRESLAAARSWSRIIKLKPPGIITEMKQRVKISIIISLVAIGIVLCTYGLVWAVSGFLDKQYARLHDGCLPHTPNHVIVVKDNKASPPNTIGNRCDTLMITNLDDISRKIAFGLHDNHVRYDGVDEQALSKGQTLTITLIQTGYFSLHDHLDEKAFATFQVR
jgi:hypothetical protein